jgi:hypothetical protein
MAITLPDIITHLQSKSLRVALRIYVIFLALLLHSSTNAQQFHVYLTTNTESSNQTLLENLPIAKRSVKANWSNSTLILESRDSIELSRYLHRTLYQTKQAGYLAASFDSIGRDSFAYQQGKYYQNINIQIIPKDSISRIVLEKGKISLVDTLLPAKQVPIYQQSIITFLENRGYAFAYTKLIFKDSTTAQADLLVNSGPLFYFVNPTSKGLPNAFVSNITRIRKGELYQYSKLKAVTQSIKSTDWVVIGAAPKVSFTGSQALVNLNLLPSQPNRLDFVLGILPNQNTGKTSITGTLDAWVFNALRLAELFEVHFERLRPQTQRLESRLRLPFISTLPIGLDTEIKMYKRDSAFLEVSLKGGISYPMRHGLVRLSWLRFSSNLIQIDTQRIKSTLKLPADLDLSKNSFQVGYQMRNYDNLFNPRKGYGIQIEGTVGLLKTRKNTAIEQLRRSDIPDFQFHTLYDTLSSNGNRFQVSGKIQYLIPVLKQSTILIGVTGAWLNSQSKLVRNELYRLGGFELIRGFDEDIFLGKAYFNTKLEYRILTGRRSFFSVFGEYSGIDIAVTKQVNLIYPLSTGAGLQLETKGGVFGLNLAVGRVNQDPIDFRSPKIHIGYISQ